MLILIIKNKCTKERTAKVYFKIHTKNDRGYNVKKRVYSCTNVCTNSKYDIEEEDKMFCLKQCPLIIKAVMQQWNRIHNQSEI